MLAHFSFRRDSIDRSSIRLICEQCAEEPNSATFFHFEVEQRADKTEACQNCHAASIALVPITPKRLWRSICSVVHVLINSPPPVARTAEDVRVKRF